MYGGHELINQIYASFLGLIGSLATNFSIIKIEVIGYAWFFPHSRANIYD